jgi:hypothetical protein
MTMLNNGLLNSKLFKSCPECKGKQADCKSCGGKGLVPVNNQQEQAIVKKYVPYDEEGNTIGTLLTEVIATLKSINNKLDCLSRMVR